MGEVIGEMVLEKAVGFLISEIGKAIQKTAMFKYHLKRLQETLESLNPVIKKIIESNKELDRTDEGTKNLKSLLENGKKLVQDCLKVKPWNLPMKHSYAKKLIDLDKSFLRSLTLLQVQAIEIGLSIAKTVRRIDMNMERNGLGYVQSEITDYCLAPEAPPLTVGLDEPLNDLRRWALGDDNSVRVLTAPGGCGKTTLAMKLCSDDKIKGKFNKNIFFVDVPKEPSLKLIVQALCKDIGSQENHFQDDKPVVNRLKRWMNEIGQNPILLVLDDVWPKWDSLINKHFAFQKPHYKVLVTSRFELFPRFGPPYHLQKLQEKEATTLLRHYAFSEDQENSRIPEDLVNQEQEKDSEARLVVVENEPPSETCSFTTANDDDLSSISTEPSSNISPNGRFKRDIMFWQMGDLLGRGSFGSVYEGIAEDGFFFAVKEVSLLDEGSQGKQSINQLEQEIALLSQFEHENIVQYYGTETDESKLYIFLELVTKGSLQNLYQKYILRDTQVSAYTRQILQGLKYLHDRNVVHRDIKCANILVDASGSVKLADFGLAKATTKLNDVKSCKGTAFWMAPEVVNRKNQGYGLPADIWSLGCTVLEMLTQKIPYSDLEGMQALFRIGKGVPPSVPDSLSNDARDFIWKCLQVNPDARATAAGLLNHSFVKRPLPTSSGSASPFLLGARSC